MEYTKELCVRVFNKNFHRQQNLRSRQTKDKLHTKGALPARAEGPNLGASTPGKKIEIWVS